MKGSIDGAAWVLRIPGVGNFPLEVETGRYAIARVPEAIASGGKVLFCQTCRRASCNPDDVAERYCGNCHEFLDAPCPPRNRGDK